MSNAKLSATESPTLFATIQKYPRYHRLLKIGGSLAGIVWFFRPRIPRTMMAVSVALTPGRTIRWRKRRFVVVDSTGFDAIIAREVGKRRLARIPVSEARPDHATGRRAASATDLVSVDEEEWQTAAKRFSILKQASSYNLPLDRRP
jgi:hypothetical protein